MLQQIIAPNGSDHILKVQFHSKIMHLKIKLLQNWDWQWKEEEDNFSFVTVLKGLYNDFG